MRHGPDNDNFATGWRADESLAPLEVMLRAPSVKYLSLDVFDTTLPRFCERPVDVFPSLGKMLAERGLLAPTVTAEEFAELRVEAERLARETRGSRFDDFEVTLGEVYAGLCRCGAVTRGGAACAEVELEAEREFCFANPLILDLIRGARATGQHVIFVSDTYLSRAQLAGLLRACGVGCSDGEVYVSSQYRAGKAEGRLFLRVLEELDAAPEEVVHVGDNYQSDFQGAAKAGVRAVHYYDANEYTAEVLSHEAEVMDAQSRRDAGAVFAVRRLAQRQSLKVGRDQSSFFRYGSFVMGPVLSSFAVWAARRFAAARVRRVLALMREGEFLGELLTGASDALGLGLEAMPCHVSRQATALPAIYELDEATLRGFWWRKEPPTLAGLAGAFNVAPEDVRWIGLPPDEPLEGEEQRHRAIEAFLSPALRHRIEFEASQARERLLTYLGQLVPLDSTEPVGLLDLGWNATIQRGLQTIFDVCRLGPRLTGCYLGLTGRYARHRIGGADLSSFFGTASESQDFLSVVVRSPEFLEQAVNSNVGSTLGYREDGHGRVVPVLGPFRCLPLETLRRDALKEGIRTYHRLVLELIAADPWCVDLCAATPRVAGLILKRVIDRPTRREAFDLGGMHHDDNFGSDSWRQICDSYGERVLREAGPTALAADHKAYWPQGTLARQAASAATVSPARHGNGTDVPTGAGGVRAAPGRVRCFWSEDGTSFLDGDHVEWTLPPEGRLEAEAELPAAARWLRFHPLDCKGMVHVERWSCRLRGESPETGGEQSAESGVPGTLAEEDLLPRVYHAEQLFRLDRSGGRWAAYQDDPRMYARVNHVANTGIRLMQLRLRVIPLSAAGQLWGDRSVRTG